MASNKTVPGRCSHCGARFQVPPETIGLVAECPHCHRQTEVLLGLFAPDSGTSRKTLIWTIIGIFILVGALGAGLFAVHLAKKLKAKHHTYYQSTDFDWIRSRG